MKARPRAAEREVAIHLSRFFVPQGFSPVERIPVIGRTGPDLQINELGLVADVKSRLEVPKTLFLDRPQEHSHGLISVPLDRFPELIDPATEFFASRFHLVSVTRFYDHMDEWRSEYFPEGISALVLHRPKMPYGKAIFLIHRTNRRRLIELWRRQTHLQTLPPPKTRA